MTQPILFERVDEHGTTRGTLPQLGQGTNNVVSRLPHYDLLSFLAILENIPSLRLFDFMPNFDNSIVERGLSGQVHGIARDKDNGVIFKRFQTPHAIGTDESKVAFQALISEIIVLEHPVFKKHPNLPKLGGITWDVEIHKKNLLRAMPVLVFRRSKFGNLRDYLTSRGIVHGDIKPENILVDEEKHGQLLTKVIDFGCSCFGTTGSDKVSLAYTPEWVAPEWRAGLFTVDEAKKTDIYSYGKVCSWIFFGTHTSTDGIPEPQFCFDRAIEAQPLMEQSKTSANPAKAALRRFFELSLEPHPDGRTSDVSRLVDLLHEFSSGFSHQRDGGRTWRTRHMTSVLRPISQMSFPFQRINHYSRVQVGRLLAFCLLGRESEFFAPGQMQALFYLSKASPLPWFVGGMIIYGVSIFFIIPDLLATYKQNSRFSPNHVILWIFLILLLPAAAYLYRIRHSNFWIEFRNSSHTFQVFGRSQHLVPNLARLIPLLDTIHYGIKAQMVKELADRAHGDCGECKTQSALQLAFCTEIGFGTSRNTTSSREWLQQSNKKKADVLRLCKEAVYYVDIYKSRKLFKKSVPDGDPVSTPLWDHYLLAGIAREAALSYEKEIVGREAAGYDSLVGDLSLGCGELCMETRDYGKAEEMFWKRLNLICRKRHLHKWPLISDVWYGPDDHYGYHVAKAREAQLRYKEAIEVIIKHSRSVMHSPNGAEFGLYPLNTSQRHAEDRILLARLMVKQGRLDDTLKMDMPSDLKKLLRMGGKDGDDINDTLENMSALVDALDKEKRLPQATTLHRKQLAMTQAIFGVDAEKAIEATCKLGSLLSRQNPSQTNEAIKLLETVGQKLVDPCNPISVQALYAQAFAISRQGDIAAALMIMRKARETMISSLGREHSQSMGCMSHLACSLNIFRAQEMSKLTSLQEDFSEICAQSHDMEIQRAILPLLVALSRPGAIEEALQLMRELLKLMEELDQSTSESYFTVMKSFAMLLSFEGYLFERQAALLEATKACTYSIERADRIFGPQSLEYLEAVNLMASICAKRTMLLYQSYGIGAEDFELMDWTLENHRKLVDLSVRILGEENDDTLIARLKCAHALSDHGVEFEIQSEKAEAESIIRSVLDSKRQILGPDDDMTLWIESQLESVQYRHGTVSIGHIEQFQRSYLQKLTERFDSAHPYRIMQQAQLASLLLHSGNDGRQALEMAREIYEYCNGSYQHLHPMTIKALETWGSLSDRYDRSDTVITARDTFWRAKATFTDVEDHPRVLSYSNKLIRVLEREGEENKDKLLKMQEEVLECMIKTRGKQNTATIAVMLQLSELLLARSMRFRAYAVLKDALELLADLVGIRHHLCIPCWRNILTAIEYRKADEEILRARIQHDIVLPLPRERQVNASDDPFEEEGEVIYRALVAGLSCRILGEDHIFTLKTKSWVRETLLQKPGVHPMMADEVICHIMECVLLPPGTVEFLEQCSVGGQAL